MYPKSPSDVFAKIQFEQCASNANNVLYRKITCSVHEGSNGVRLVFDDKGRTNDDTPAGGPFNWPTRTHARPSSAPGRTDGQAACATRSQPCKHARATSPVPAGRQLGLCRVVSILYLRRGGRGAGAIMRTSKGRAIIPVRISGAASRRICARSGRPGGGSREFQLPDGGPRANLVVCASTSPSRPGRTRTGLASRRFSAAAPTPFALR